MFVLEYRFQVQQMVEQRDQSDLFVMRSMDDLQGSMLLHTIQPATMKTNMSVVT